MKVCSSIHEIQKSQNGHIVTSVLHIFGRTKVIIECVSCRQVNKQRYPFLNYREILANRSHLPLDFLHTIFAMKHVCYLTSFTDLQLKHRTESCVHVHQLIGTGRACMPTSLNRTTSCHQGHRATIILYSNSGPQQAILKVLDQVFIPQVVFRRVWGVLPQVYRKPL